MSLTTPNSAREFPSVGFLALPNRLGLAALREVESRLAARPVLLLVEDGYPPADDVMAHIGQGKHNVHTFSDAPESFHSLKLAVDAILLRGGVAVFVPGASIVRRGTLLHGRSAAYGRLLLLDVPVVPVFVEHPREGLLSIEKPGAYADKVILSGQVLRSGHATMARLLEELMLLGEEAFSARPVLQGNLAYAVLQGMKKHGSKVGMIDGMDESKMRYDRLLAVAIAFSQRIKELTDKPRIGIVLPPGRAGLIANVAALFAGKTPVNMNYTAGKEAVESAFRQADIDKVITVDAFIRRMQKFPWPPNREIIFLEREMPALKPKIIQWIVASKLMPAAMIASSLGIPRTGGDAEAVLMFTSGSSGEPKGVPLSHANILANTAQFSARLSLGSDDTMLGSLPLFHSFGSTVTMWYPLLEGIRLATFPSPLEVDKICGLVQRERVTVLIATPTFLRGYLKRARPEQLASLRMVITGAEKLPVSLAESFERKFGHKVLEGYGLTETSPATNFNLPNLPATGNLPVAPSHRIGSVGHFVPGLAIRVTDPATDEVLPVDRSGIIWFKGANVFNGYLHWGPKNREVVQEGWFRTGDIGRIDDEGFLYIEGRLSRFSKIGGEMVPHERVEEYLVRALGYENDDMRKLVVVGVPDPSKGEALMLLSTTAGEYLDQEMIDLRYRLLEMNVPSLWIPRKLIKVADIPVLASGKLDLRACEALARKASGA